jgi:hypothetical protein
VIARDKFEELDVQKQNADDDDSQHQHIKNVKYHHAEPKKTDVNH